MVNARVMIRTLWFWSTFVLSTVLLFGFLCLRMAFTAIKGDFKRSLAAHEVATLWGKSVFLMNPGWQVTLEGQNHLPPASKPSVVVANHQSAMDICALFNLGIQFRWLSKASVFRLPLIGQAMQWAGYVPVIRGNKASHEEALELSGRWLRRGVSMVFFPEGTRSVDGVMRPFKSGAFRLADAQGVAVTPVVIQGTKELMRKKSFIPNPSRVRIKVLAPEVRKEGETLEEFTERIRTMMLHELDSKEPSHQVS